MANSTTIWDGEAALYNETRPSPPIALLDILTQLIQTPKPTLVVDLGCGTGLSTMVWGERAEHVIGVEPSDDMRSQAINALAKYPYASHIEIRAGEANQTGLADTSADIVTSAQSFHWMEPTTTLAEVARILRPGGIFAVYDYGWPPIIKWELEQAFNEVDERFERLIQERGTALQIPRWTKEQHLDRIRASGHFRFTRELSVHHREMGNAARFIGLIMTSGYSYEIRQGTVTEEEIGFDQLKQAAREYIGSEPIPWYFSYQVRIGIK